MRARLAALAAASAVIAFAIPSHAATVTKKFTLVTDETGDAAPAGAAADIVSITAANTFKTKTVNGVVKYIPTGASITLNLAAAPDNNTFYVIDTTASGNCPSVSFIYDNFATPPYRQNRAICEGTATSTTIEGVTGKVSGKSIVFKLPLGVFPVGTTFSEVSATTEIGAVPAIGWDDTDPSATPFTVGQR